MPNKMNSARAKSLINTMGCARWIVGQFEELGCDSIARVFQRAVDDADAWIQTKALNGHLPKEAAEPIKSKEAIMIHNLLIKYASISDPERRKQILDDMLESVHEEANEGGKTHAGHS